MTPRQRQEEIIRLAATTGLPGVEELSARFSAPPAMIRRDLATLEFLRRPPRSVSAATALGQHPGDSLRERSHTALDARRGIARWAARQIGPGETILLDTGSTVAALAHQLRPAHDLTVATASLAVLHELSGAESIHVECLGGTLRQASQSSVGPLAEAALERMTFDRAFLGADGLTAEDGLCAFDLQHARLKELVARRAARIYVLVHSATLGRRPFHAWARLPEGWTLVTDDFADSASLAPFLAHDMAVVVVDAQGIATAEV
jgi:DeoR/GlpR family transcriptional regulator of sugar metabolism